MRSGATDSSADEWRLGVASCGRQREATRERKPRAELSITRLVFFGPLAKPIPRNGAVLLVVPAAESRPRAVPVWSRNRLRPPSPDAVRRALGGGVGGASLRRSLAVRPSGQAGHSWEGLIASRAAA